MCLITCSAKSLLPEMDKFAQLKRVGSHRMVCGVKINGGYVLQSIETTF